MPLLTPCCPPDIDTDPGVRRGRRGSPVDAAQVARWVATAIGAVVAIIGAGTLAGWALEIELLKRAFPGAIAMNPATACTFILLGVALILRVRRNAGLAAKCLAVAFGAAVICIGAGRVATYLAGADSWVDRALFSAAVESDVAGPSRMAPNTAASFICCGLVILALDLRAFRGLVPANWIALVPGACGTLALLGHAYGVSSFYLVGRFIGMAPNTAFCLVLFSIGALLARPDRGFVAISLDRGVAGVLARRLLPTVLIVPPLLGWARLEGHRLGWFSTELGIACYAGLMMIALGVVGVVSVRAVHAIDQRRIRAEADLRLSEARFARAVHGSSDGLWDWRVGTNDVWYSPQYKRLLGFEAHEFADRFESWKTCVHPDDYNPTMDAVRRHLYQGEPYDVEFRLRTKAGEYRWFRSRGRSEPDETGKPARMAGSVQDIHALRCAERLAERREMELRTVLNSTADGIISLSAQGVILTFNAAAESMFACRSDEVVGKPLSLLMPAIEIDKLAAPAAQAMPAAEADSLDSDRELEGRRRDGAVFRVALRVREVRQGEAGGGDSRFVGVVQDITQRRALEQMRDELVRSLQRTAIELARSNRELEEFAFVASHDLRAPLRAIRSLTQWLAEDLGENVSAENKERIALLLSRAERLDRLIDDLLQFSRAGCVVGKVHDVDVAELVEELADLLAAPGFEIVQTSPLPRLTTASAPLQLVLRNLISNAIKHHDRTSGRVEVSAIVSATEVSFCVADDGPGIPEQFHARVFGMFETLRPRDSVEGSGMGLAVVKRIVERFGGAVTLSSDGRRGTAVRFTWPRTIQDETGAAMTPIATREADEALELVT